MTDVAVTERSRGKLDPQRDNSCSERRHARPIPTAPLPRQIAAGELLERVAEVPSREGMRPPRADYANNLRQSWSAVWRWAHGRRSGQFRITWRQLYDACGLPERDYDHPETSVRRYMAVFEEAGVLTISGRDELADGRTCVVTLLEPPARLESADRRRSSAGQGTSCTAVRRRETRSQRADRRDCPYRRKGGRGRATPTHDFYWGSYVSTQGVDPPKGGSTPTTKDVRAREAEPPGGGLMDAIRPRGCGAGNAGPVPDVGAALEAARTAAARGGVRALEELAGVPGAHPVVLAIVAWELLFGGRPGLSRRRRLHLERACAVHDRLDGRRGAGVGRLLWMMNGVACDLADQAEGARTGSRLALDRHRTQPAPATLNYFVTRLRSSGRSRRGAARRAKREPGAPGSSGAGTDA